MLLSKKGDDSMNYYERSKRIFVNKLKENRNITKEEWDDHAREKCLFSANTLMFHTNVKSFEKLKEKFS